MDIRRTSTMVIMFVVIMVAMQYLPALWNKPPAPTPTTATAPASTASAPALPAEAGATPRQILLGNPQRTKIAGVDPTKLALTINTVTAGIDLVQLNVNDYANTIAKTDPLELLIAQPDLPKPYSTLSIHANIGNIWLHYETSYVWKVTKESPTEVDLLRTLLDDKAQPIARITKTFQIDPATYDVTIAHHVENLTPNPLPIQIDEMAATDLPTESTNPSRDDRFFHAAAIDTDKKLLDGDRFNATHAELFKLAAPKPIGQFNNFAAGQTPFVWVANSNRFFTAITRPLPVNPASTFALSTGTIPMPEHVSSADINILRLGALANDCVFGVRLTGSPVTIASHTTASLPMTVFFGPKDRTLLHGKEGAPVGTDEYNFDIYKYARVIQFNATGCFIYNACPIDFLAQTLLWLLDGLFKTVAFHNYGLAIIILVIIIRAILHPLTRSSQVNMATMGKKMNTIKPLIDAVKKRYPDDRKKVQEEQMRIYRENDVNPAGSLLGCLPMLIQMPIWVAMYSGLWADIHLRHAVFIPGWINDLATPDAVLSFPAFSIPLLSSLTGPISSLNLLPILLGVVFFFQMKVQMASQPKPADEQQAQMQNMSKYMFFVLPVFLYSAPAGLNLYYFASTGAGLVDTYFVRKTLRKRGILPPNSKDLPIDDEDDEEKKTNR